MSNNVNPKIQVRSLNDTSTIHLSSTYYDEISRVSNNKEVL